VAEKVPAFGGCNVRHSVHADDAAQGAETEGLVVAVGLVRGGLLGEDGLFALFTQRVGEWGCRRGGG